MPRILVILYVVAFVSSCGSIALSIFHSIRMMQEIRGSQQTKASFLGPFILFMPGLFTDKGNHHRYRSGAYLLVALVSIALATGLRDYLNP